MSTQTAAPTYSVATVHNPAGTPFVIACRDQFVRPDGIAFDDPVMKAYLKGSLDMLWPLPPIAAAMLRPGDRVLDVGSHVGGFALLAASLGCRVTAIEASPWNAELIRRSIELNGFRDLRVLNVAAADQPGELQFASLGPWGQVSCESVSGPTVRVPAVRVDDVLAELGWDKVEFLKLDVEGYEVRALHGMSRLLSRPDAPPVYFESNSHTLKMYDETPNSLFAVFRSYGYEVFNWDETGAKVLIPAEGFEQTNVVVDYLAEKPGR
jgi:FkbM family methyltransferase